MVLALLAWCIGSLWPHLANLWLRLVCSFAVAAVQGRLVPAVADFLANPHLGRLASPCLPVHEAVVPTLATGARRQQPTRAHA